MSPNCVRNIAKEQITNARDSSFTACKTNTSNDNWNFGTCLLASLPMCFVKDDYVRRVYTRCFRFFHFGVDPLFSLPDGAPGGKEKAVKFAKQEWSTRIRHVISFFLV